jgi:hypothetical protein
MAGDVYAKQKTYHGGSFSSDSAALTVNGVQLGIVQNAQIQFAQAIARVYDVGNAGKSGEVPVWYVGGRAQGQATLARILGPASGGLYDFYNTMGNVCKPQSMSFKFAAGCSDGTGTSTTYRITSAVMVNVGISVSAQDMIVNENVSLMFANLEVTTG